MKDFSLSQVLQNEEHGFTMKTLNSKFASGNYVNVHQLQA